MISIKRTNRFVLLLFLSFIPFTVQVVTYLFIGNIYPLLLAMVLVTPFVYFLKKKSNTPKAVKYWSLLIICYGTVRLLLHLLCHLDSSGIPSGVYYQFTIWYAIKSVLYIILGWFLFTKRKYLEL